MRVLPSSPLQSYRLVDTDRVSMDYSLVGQQSGPGYFLHRVLFCKRRSITTNATLNVVLAKYPECHGESGEGSVALDSEDVSYTDPELNDSSRFLPDLGSSWDRWLQRKPCGAAPAVK